jgi:hypothetical protein
MRLMPRAPFLTFCVVALAACAGSENRTGNAGSGGGAAGATGAAGSAQAGQTGTAGSSTGGTSAAGATGAAGTTGVAGTGAAGTGAAGAAGSGVGGASASSCAGKNYPLCIDFESGIDTTKWTGGTASSIVTDNVAHGTHSYLLYRSARNGMPELHGGRLLSKTVGTIKNQVWVRFYLHFAPGAPGGHSNLIAAYDGNGAWYELGVQFDGLMGVWHGGGGETPLRSMPLIVDQWYCVEAYFDGAAAAAPKWYLDGTEVTYYMPGGGPKIQPMTQLMRLEAGLTSYAGLQLKMPDGKGDQSETRVVTDLWIDDVAFDTQRIGCIQ